MVKMAGYPKFRIEVRPLSEIDDHQVCLFADDLDLVALFAYDFIGLDPEELLNEPCVLRARSAEHIACIARCDCGVVECGSVNVYIRSGDGCVTWAAINSDLEVRFDTVQYSAEVERALLDHTWETPERKAARLIKSAIKTQCLEPPGFELDWVSGRAVGGRMTAAFTLRPGPFQVLLQMPWDADDIDAIVYSFQAVLERPPEEWPEVRCYPQTHDLGLPAIAGPGWS